MPWAKGILLFIMVVTTLSSSLRPDSKAFSETTSYGAVSENTVRFGKLLIVGQGTVSDKDMKTSGMRSMETNEGN